MEIHIGTIVLNILVAASCYGIFWTAYRYVLHPDYRWHQRGNRCYESARDFAWTRGLALFVIIIAIEIMIVYEIALMW